MVGFLLRLNMKRIRCRTFSFSNSTGSPSLARPGSRVHMAHLLSKKKNVFLCLSRIIKYFHSRYTHARARTHARLILYHYHYFQRKSDYEGHTFSRGLARGCELYYGSYTGASKVLPEVSLLRSLLASDLIDQRWHPLGCYLIVDVITHTPFTGSHTHTSHPLEERGLFKSRPVPHNPAPIAVSSQQRAWTGIMKTKVN